MLFFLILQARAASRERYRLDQRFRSFKLALPDTGIDASTATDSLRAMIVLSRRSLSWLCIAGFALAAAGWTKAWMNGSVRDEFGEAGELREARHDGRSSSRGRGSSDGASLVSDPRSQRLVRWMTEMEDLAQPGKPNPAFIKASAATLDDSLYHRRQRDFRLLMEKMRPEDAPAIHAQFKALERDGRYFAEYAAFAMRWGQIAGEEALAHWLDSPRSHGNLVEFMTGWATSQPEKALAWVNEHQSELGDSNAYRPLLVGWINTDPVSASAWLENADLPPHQVVDCVNGALLDKIYSDGIEGASAWLASLPDHRPEFAEAARQAWMSHLIHQGNLDPRKAAATWGALGSRSWMQAQDFQRFCQSVAEGNQGSLEDFVENLASSWPSGEVSAQMERWAGSDPQAAAAAISTLPDSPIRATATEAFLQTVGRSDERAADEWRGWLE